MLARSDRTSESLFRFLSFSQSMSSRHVSTFRQNGAHLVGVYSILMVRIKAMEKRKPVQREELAMPLLAARPMA